MLRKSARLRENERARKERKADIYKHINKAIAFDEKEKRLAKTNKRRRDSSSSSEDESDDVEEASASASASAPAPAPQKKKSLGYSIRLEPRNGKVEAIIDIPGLPPNMIVNVTVKGQDGRKVTQRSFQGYKSRLTVATRGRGRALTPSTESSSDSDSVVEVQPSSSKQHTANAQQHVRYPQQQFRPPQAHAFMYGPGANRYGFNPGFYGPPAGLAPQVAPGSAKLPQGAAQQPAYFGPGSGPAPQVAPIAAIAPRSAEPQSSLAGPSANPPAVAPVAAMQPQNAVQQLANTVPQASPSAQSSVLPSPITPGFFRGFQPTYPAQQPGGYGPQAPYMQNSGRIGAQHHYYPAQGPGMWAPQTHPAGQPQWRPLGAAPTLPYAPVQEPVHWIPRPSTNSGEASDSGSSSPAGAEDLAPSSPDSLPSM